MLLQDDQIKVATEEKMRDMRYGNLCGHISCSFCVQICAYEILVFFALTLWPWNCTFK